MTENEQGALSGEDSGRSVGEVPDTPHQTACLTPFSLCSKFSDV